MTLKRNASTEALDRLSALPDLTPVAGAPYRVVFSDGTQRTGTLDSQGHAKLTGIPAGPIDVFYGEDPRAPALASGRQA